MVPETFLSFWTIFCSFTAITTQKIKILKKWKKTPGDMFLHTCTKNHHHILCGSWFGTQWKLLFFILGYFLHFNLPNSLKNQNFLKMKKTTGDIIILHMCPKNHDHMPYGSWDMAHNGCQCYFSFWAIFCPFTSLTIQKIKISKK